jgi:uncharacterized protein
MRPEPAHNKYTMAAPGDVQAPRRYRAGVLVLLPPSETKRGGGDGPPLRLDLLAHPELNPLRAQLLDELVKLAAEPEAARAALGLSAQQHAEVARNAELWT